jgi:hypothetical protein
MQSDGIRIGDQPTFTLDIGRHLLLAMQKVVGSSPIKPLRAPPARRGSREDDELARRPTVFHVGMRFGDLVERVRSVDRDRQTPLGDRVEVAL